MTSSMTETVAVTEIARKALQEAQGSLNVL